MKMEALTKDLETSKGKESDFTGIFSEISGLNVQLMAKCDQQVAAIDKLQVELRDVNDKFSAKSQECDKYQARDHFNLCND